MRDGASERGGGGGGGVMINFTLRHDSKCTPVRGIVDVEILVPLC